MKIAFIGLGVMGGPMAGHLAGRHEVIVHNRSSAKAQDWAAAHGGAVAADVERAVAGADMVALCLPTDAETVPVARAALAVMKAGAILVDHGSGAPDVARMLAGEAAAQGIDYLDAPISGGRTGAEKGSLAVLVGGRRPVFDRALPAFECFGADIRLMGDVGAGHLTKMANIIMGHGTALAMAEALGFVMSAGLDPSKVVDVLMQGSSRSWQLEHRSGAMIARDFTTRYPVAFARKDLWNTMAAARGIQANMPLSALADQIYANLERAGFGAADASSLIEYFAPRGERDID